MAYIIIPSVLKKFTDQQDTLQLPGTTVHAVIQNLCQCYPNLKPFLLDEKSHFINIYLNACDIRTLKDAAITDQDILTIVPALQGG